MLTVCHFTTVHRPFDVRVFHREACGLARAGYRVILLAHADFAERTEQGVVVRGVPRPRNRLQRLMHVARFVRLAIAQHADVYHFHDPELLPGGVLIKWLYRRPVIYDCHENFPETAFERVWYPAFLRPFLAKAIGILEPLMARRLDAVVCVVPDQEERFRSKGCRTVLVRNFPRLEPFDKAFQAALPKENRIIYLGGLTAVKGTRMLVDIMRELRRLHPEVRLVALGSFNEAKVKADVLRYVEQEGLSEAIRFIDQRPHEEVPNELVRSRVALVPWQRNEQTLRMFFPNKVFEYMACGLPIVASDLPSLRALLENGRCGLLVAPDDPRAHAEAIAYLLDHPHVARRMGLRGRKLVHSRYRWENEEKHLLDLYRDLLHLHPA
ncbi:MAG: glycosyltransferase family 4 protein [candidate division KSB1 bacterium]|nr:glycosyltransferase family 4 protein [candidate division KSB1 bacterium]